MMGAEAFWTVAQSRSSIVRPKMKTLMSSRNPLLALSLIASLACGQVVTCPGSGLTVSRTRIGDAFTLDIQGPAGAAAVLASDLQPGPTLTPYGSVCLGLTPSLVVTPIG